MLVITGILTSVARAAGLPRAGAVTYIHTPLRTILTPWSRGVMTAYKHRLRRKRAKENSKKKKIRAKNKAKAR